MSARKGYTLTEILVSVSILVVLSAAVYQSMRPMLLRSNVVSEMTKFKAMINRSKAAAMETTAPVLVDLADGELLALVDLDRGGDFGNDANGSASTDELVVGEGLDKGVGIYKDKKKHVVFIQAGDSDLGTDVIPHPSGAYNIEPSDLTGYSTFVNDQFIITPQGLIRSAAPPYAPVNGTFFLKSSDGFMLTLVHVTGMGEVRTATKNRNEGDWVWQ